MSGLYTQLTKNIGAFAVCIISSEDGWSWPGVLGGVWHLPELWGVRCIVFCIQLSSIDFVSPRSWKLSWSIGCQNRAHCRSWPILWFCSCCWESWRIHWNMGYGTTHSFLFYGCAKGCFPQSFLSSSMTLVPTRPRVPLARSGSAVVSPSLAQLLCFSLWNPCPTTAWKKRTPRCVPVFPAVYVNSCSYHVVPGIPRSARLRRLNHGSWRSWNCGIIWEGGWSRFCCSLIDAFFLFTSTYNVLLTNCIAYDMLFWDIQITLK